ncbi:MULTISPECIES: AAA-like domain-containing protein [unclassified Nostoc]|uniref:AAA-like domain-containing protein n=1 Tax=unclassified Nostoc TaxID=2593658 RepID=UPI00262D626A|nr:AAA-like domain-containing protein [Nostoc sp. S13]MDF5735368.1 AAA-like domain-containing protein [Nostoc sp. S13]
MNQGQKYYHVGGDLNLDDPSYIERQADRNLYEKLEAGDFCYVFNSRQMGKSSLRVRVKNNLETAGFKCVVISLDKLGTKGFTEEQWYNSLIKNIADKFNLQTELLSDLTPLDRLNSFFEKKLLTEIEQKIVIFIDEIDTVLSLDFPTDDFFAFIRSCYNERANNRIYERITFALLGVATPSQLIQDTRRTPFNIGEAIQLNGFSLQEARPLTRGLESKVNDPRIAEYILKEILKWTGGQPFLTQKIFKIIADHENIISSDEKLISKWIEGLVKLRIIENWEYQDEPQHLRTIHNRIINSKEPLVKLLKLYLKVLQNKELPVNDSLEQSELILSGLLEERNGKLKVYNFIYESVFNSNWVAEMLAEMRPYEEQLLRWLSSNRQDKSSLLQGQELQKAIAWRDGKILNIEDYQFIDASQVLEIVNLGIKIQKKERFQRLLAGITVSMMIINGVSVFQLQKTIQSEWLRVPYVLNPELFSQGEKSFFLGDEISYQNKGVEAFNKGDYSKAIEFFKTSKDIDKSDPEVVIYYNNSLAQEQAKKINLKPITVAVVVPMYARRTSAIAMLRGVALAQNEFNESKEKVGFKSRLLNVRIANDSNNPDQARKVAKELIKDSDVLAVIGHNASQASKSALEVYQNNDLAMIAATSASTELQGKGFFRTILSTKVAAKYLADYAIKDNIKKVVIYYNRDAYSKDIKEKFEASFKEQRGKVRSSIDLEDSQRNLKGEFLENLASINHPDAVVFFPNTESVSTVIKIVSYKKNVYPELRNLPLLGGGTLYTSEILKQAKENIEGLILTVPWFPEEKSSKEFAERACREWDDKIDWATASSYDATQAFIAAVSKSDLSKKNASEQRKDVIEKLKSIKLPPEKTSGERLQFINGERKDAKPVLVKAVEGIRKKCGSIEGGGFRFEQVPEN